MGFPPPFIVWVVLWLPKIQDFVWRDVYPWTIIPNFHDGRTYGRCDYNSKNNFQKEVFFYLLNIWIKYSHKEKWTQAWPNLVTYSTSSLNDVEAFENLEPSFQHCRKEAMKTCPKFSVMHITSILVPNSLPSSFLISFICPKVSLTPPNFKFKMQEKILNTFFTSMVDIEAKAKEWPFTCHEMTQFIKEVCVVCSLSNITFFVILK